MSGRHISDAEGGFRVCNISPDMCIVNGQVVPFDITRELPPELQAYAKTVKARGEKVLPRFALIRAVEGNAGKGVSSGVSQGSGHTWLTHGEESVRVEGRLCTRHLDLCEMNCSA